ncbi:MAG: hypothetical protein ABIZ04_10355 [Opitutus sp.]
MDRDLPFGFLDHKFRCGNGIVGCWFDRFQDFPALCLHRPGDDAGDKAHATAVHCEKGRLTAALKTFRDETLKPALVRWIESQDPGVFSFLQSGQSAADLQIAATRRMEELHALPVHETEARAAFYHEQVEPALAPLRAAFDTWCALWFWPVEEVHHLPLPIVDATEGVSANTFTAASLEARAIVARLRAQLRFFHWELEFPDVFTSRDAGFDAILGNPPWETLQPVSHEWFSNHDPLYRTYGKQEALHRQKELFTLDPKVEQDWLDYCGKFKALSNWCANVAFPWADPVDESIGGGKWSLARSSASGDLHRAWRARRATRQGFADGAHPFRHQGEGKPHTYKLFLEQVHALLRSGGRVGLLVPSGIYTDHGTMELRELLLSRCNWTHLYSFQNERFVFREVHHAFKVATLSFQKTGVTDGVLTRFRLGPGDSPELGELETDIANISSYFRQSRELIQRLSPHSGSLLELRSERDARIVEKLYRHGVLLGDDSPKGWSLKYRQGDFNMTSDSKLFPPRPVWEEQGYRADEYGHWLKGAWLPITECGLEVSETWLREPWTRSRSILRRRDDLILSRDGMRFIGVKEIEDAALPLYEGRMIDHFDFSPKGWVRGKGRGAVWRDIPWEGKSIEPQFLMALRSFILGTTPPSRGRKISFMDIGAPTNERSMYASSAAWTPFGHTSPVFVSQQWSIGQHLALLTHLNSFVYDFNLRQRLGGLHLTWHYLEETVLPPYDAAHSEAFAANAAALNWAAMRFAAEWIDLKHDYAAVGRKNWKQLFALTAAERVRRRAVADALSASISGLDVRDFEVVLQGCDHPREAFTEERFSRRLDPKGFWRSEREKDPELRHTVLAQVAFQDLQRLGLDAFLALNEGEGWMLPETLRLTDYGLGHDDRAREPQPVASRLGPRYYPWQLEGTVEESWEECRRHAALIRAIRAHGQPAPNASAPASTSTDLLGIPIETDLFGNEVVKRTKR